MLSTIDTIEKDFQYAFKDRIITRITEKDFQMGQSQLRVKYKNSP